MLNLNHFKYDHDDENEVHPTVIRNYPVVNLTYKQLQTFSVATINHDKVLWKSGNMYLKLDHYLQLQAFIGGKLNELQCPIFCHTYGVVKSKYVPIPIDLTTNYLDPERTILNTKSIALLHDSRTYDRGILTQDAGINIADMIDHLENESYNFSEVFMSIFVMTVMGLYQAKKRFNFSHGDLHQYNIVYKKYTGWVTIGDEQIYSHGFVPTIIDFGSSFMKIDDKIYSTSSENIRIHNNHIDAPNNIGDIFRVFHFFFIANKNYQSDQSNKIKEYLVSQDFDNEELIKLVGTKEYWFTPKCEDFDFDNFVLFLRSVVPEYFGTKENITSLMNDNTKMFGPPNMSIDAYIYLCLKLHPENGLKFMDNMIQSCLDTFYLRDCINLIKSVVLTYCLPTSTVLQIRELINWQ